MNTTPQVGDRVVLVNPWIDRLERTLRRLGMASEVDHLRGAVATVTAVRHHGSRTTCWLRFDTASDSVSIPYPKTSMRKVTEGQGTR